MDVCIPARNTQLFSNGIEETNTEDKMILAYHFILPSLNSKIKNG